MKNSSNEFARSLPWFLSLLLEAQCSVYTIMLGTNEANNRWTWTPEQFEEANFVETYKKQYRTLIDKVQEANPSAEILLVTCPKIIADNEQGSPADVALDTYVIPAIKAVASEYGLDVIDLNAEMADYVADGNQLSSWGYVDFLHFSASGAAKLGEFFAQELTKFLGL